MNEIKRELTEHIADLNDDKFKLELNRVAWNDGEAKLDIRPWWDDHQKCGKGVQLTHEEGRRLYRALSHIYK